jgi:hypothetical protein
MDQDFDLFGDPIPQGRGARGRPKHVATTENRNKVKLLLALNWTNERIAAALCISQPTLRSNYFQELKLRDIQRDRLDARRFELAMREANKGNVAALKELGKMIEAEDRKKAVRDFDRTGDEEVLKPAKIGKKEAARLAAEQAGSGGGWGDDLKFAGRPASGKLN